MSDKRTIAIKVRVNEAERDFITRIMESAGYRSRERFIRKMILDGVIFRMNMEDVQELLRLVANATSNINQITRRINETRSMYGSDMVALRQTHQEMHTHVDTIVKKFTAICNKLNKTLRV